MQYVVVLSSNATDKTATLTLLNGGVMLPKQDITKDRISAALSRLAHSNAYIELEDIIIKVFVYTDANRAAAQRRQEETRNNRASARRNKRRKGAGTRFTREVWDRIQKHVQSPGSVGEEGLCMLKCLVLALARLLRVSSCRLCAAALLASV